MHLFLDTADEFATRAKPLILKDIAAACDLAANRPSKWMRIPEFREAFTLVIRRAHPTLIEGAVTSLLQQAVRGNLLAFDKVMDRLERWGRIATMTPAAGSFGNPDGHAVGGVNVFVGIPQREPFESLPQPRVLPAPPATQPPAPAERSV